MGDEGKFMVRYVGWDVVLSVARLSIAGRNAQWVESLAERNISAGVDRLWTRGGGPTGSTVAGRSARLGVGLNQAWSGEGVIGWSLWYSMRFPERELGLAYVFTGQGNR